MPGAKKMPRPARAAARRVGKGPAGASGENSGFIHRHVSRQKKRHFRHNLIAVGITGCVVAACVFWVVAFTFYNVSSNSMYPALQGFEGDRDRLLCWRLAYRYREPRRWEIAIFEAPANAANVEVMPGFHSGGETGLTVKRVAGLPGERLALAGGDVWTAPPSGSVFRRQVKPDSVQRGMWIDVYREDFSDLRTLDEFGVFWKPEGLGDAMLDGLPSLVLRPREGEYGFRYLPQARTGVPGTVAMTVLPGVPDRYVLDQSVFFHCPNPRCGQDFSAFVNSQKIVGRCPACGLLCRETAVTYYGLRSGLPEIGPYHAGFRGLVQGDSQHFRPNSYYFVADLRVVAEVMPLEPGASFGLELGGNDQIARLRLDDRAALVNGMPAPVTGGLKAGEWTRVEFSQSDGAVRLFLGPERTPLFDQVLWPGEKPDPGFDGGKSGVAFGARGGAIAVRLVAIARDVHYFSGREQAVFNYLTAMDGDGSIVVGDGRFFPLGDNTTVSLDGRSWGPVNVSRLRGVPLYIVRPKARAGFIPSP